MHHRDLRQFLAHQLALGRVVVGEDEAVEAEVQRLGDPPQPGGLVVPRAFEGGEVGAPEHAASGVEPGGGDRRAVLGTHREHHPALAQRLQVGLKFGEGFAGGRAGADGDAVRPVFADHPAPQRVVEVEHQHLLGPGVRRAPGGAERRQVVRQPARVEVELRRVPEAGGAEVARADLLGQRGHVHPVHPPAPGLQQFGVEPAHLVGRRGGGEALGDAAIARGGGHQGVLDDLHPFRRQPVPEAGEQPGRFGQRGLHFRHRGADRQRCDQVAPVGRDHREVRREAVQRRGGVEDLLDVGAERGLVDRGRRALGQDGAGDRAGEVVERDAAEDGDALRLGGGGGVGGGGQDAIAGLEDRRQGRRVCQQFPAQIAQQVRVSGGGGRHGHRCSGGSGATVRSLAADADRAKSVARSAPGHPGLPPRRG